MVLTCPLAFNRGKKDSGWRFLLHACCAVSAMIPITEAWANTELDPFELSPEQLFDATVISASKTTEKLWDVPAAVYVLTHEDIKRSGATSIPEVLRLVPGVQVSRISNGTWAISVRGFNSALSNKLLVLMDGREVYDPLFSGVHWDVQDTVMGDIERIEVIRGPGATLWGANAVNGVINIITKQTQDTQGNRVTVAAGNEERWTTARHGGKLSDKGHYRVYGKYLYRDEQQKPSGRGAEDEWDAWRGGFRTDWAGNAQDSFTVQGDLYHSQQDQFVSIPSLISPFAAVNEATFTSRGGNLLGRWNRELGEDARFSVQGYYDYIFQSQPLVEDTRQTFDLDAQLEQPLSERHLLTIGGRYRYSSDHIMEGPTVTFHPADRSDRILSSFIQDKITLVPETWFLTLGSKFEHNDYSGIEIQPNARLQWHPNDIQMVWGSIGRAVRTPSRLEHDVDLELATLPPGTLPLPINANLQASPDFDSEELIAYELGYRHQLSPDLLLDTTAFYNDYDKLTTYSLGPSTIINNGIDPVHVFLPILTTNSTEGETYGIETVVNWRARDNLNFSAAYSFIEVGLQGPPSEIAIGSEAAEGWTPQHQFNLRTMWDIRKDVSWDTTLYYVDSIPTFQVKDYWRLDTRLGWRVSDGLELSLVGQNLLQSAHREYSSPTDLNSTEIERGFYGKATWYF